jgi:hypothetical protein
MYKKMILFLITLTFAFSLLVGCGGKDNRETVPEEPVLGEGVEEETSEKPGAEAEEEVAEAPPEKVSLTLEGPGNLMSNLLHDGTAAFYEGYVYHSDKMMYGNLMRTDTVTDETELLVKGTLHDINIGDGKIFTVGYIEPENPNDLSINGIFMIDLDGSNVTVLKEGYFEELVLYDEYLYFYETMEGKLIRMKYDATDESVLLEGVYPEIVIINDSLYLHTSLGETDFSSYIFKMPLSGGEPEKIDPVSTFGGTIHVAKNEIVYISRDNGSGMMRYDTETGVISSFLDTWISDIVYDEEWIYYFWSGRRQDNADKGIYKSRFDGSEAALIKAIEFGSSFNIAGGNLYYLTNDEKRRITRLDLETLEESFVPLAEELIQ